MNHLVGLFHSQGIQTDQSGDQLIPVLKLKIPSPRSPSVPGKQLPCLITPLPVKQAGEFKKQWILPPSTLSLQSGKT